MIDEQELERQTAIEMNQFLDEWHAQVPDPDENENSAADLNDYVAEPAPIPCTCYYTDVDVVENRYCEAHGPRF